MINEKTYLEMKRLITDYENRQLKPHSIESYIEKPYIEVIHIETEFKYNPRYGDDRICECGHSYYRHFDSYEHMEAIGCKYCNCDHFIESKPNK